MINIKSACDVLSNKGQQDMKHPELENILNYQINTANISLSHP